MYEHCAVCGKPITGVDVYGPIHYPCCWACWGNYEQKILDIIAEKDAAGKRKSYYQIAAEIRRLPSLPETDDWDDDELSEIEVIKGNIEALEEEIDGLEWELIRERRRLRELEKGKVRA